MNKNKQDRVQICARLEAIRKSKGLSTYKLAELAGLTRQEISFIEKGKRSVGIDLLLKIVNALDCEIKIE
jgi:transcriptional regulator with XRE-family HTH domain